MPEPSKRVSRAVLTFITLLTMPIWLPMRWLLEGTVASAKAIWRLWGQTGLAIRWFLGASWRFIGRIGLATRHLLVWLFWEPLYFLVLRPLFFLYRSFLHPLLLLLWYLLKWLFGTAQTAIRAGWQATAPRRALLRRRWHSWWIIRQARWRVFWRRRKPPKTAVFAPRTPRRLLPNMRLVRLSTALASLAVLIVLSFLNYRNQLLGSAVAGNGFFLPRTVIVTPSPVPPTPTIPPTPTADIRLTPWPTPDPLNQGGSVAFTWQQNGNSDIYVLGVGQSQPIRLTNHPAVDREPAWSPAGDQIAFTSHRDGNWDIYVYDLSSQTLQRITEDVTFDGGPSWSPDGQWLVYESAVSGNLDIYIIKADRSEGPYRLTEHPTPDYAPAWSPEGRHVAFVSWRLGHPDIYLMSLDNIDDSAVSNLTATTDQHEEEPAFSPDGRFLAYTETSTGLPLLYALPLGPNAALAGPPASLGQQGNYPAWSPDSQSVMTAHETDQTSYLAASSPDAWGVAPQAFIGNGRISHPSWSSTPLTPALVESMAQLDGTPDDAPLFVEAQADPGNQIPPFKIWPVTVSVPSPYLSDRVDQSFVALRQRVMQEAGWDFLGQLDKLFEPIDSGAGLNEDPRTWNKAGRAFDLYYRHALGFEPTMEVVRLDVGGQIYWRVYVKTAVQDGSQGEPLRQLPWDFRARFGDEPQFYSQGGAWKENIPAGYYIDFTALAADYGWVWVPAADNWRTYFPSVRFWHYENQQGLTWRDAMLEIYKPEELLAAFGG